MKISPDTPATASVERLENGGVKVTAHVPGYEGIVDYGITVSRSVDGDWCIFIPWFADLHGNPCADQADLILENGTGVTNGISYVGAPDVEYEEQ